MKKTLKRTISLALSLLICLSFMNISAFADNSAGGAGTVADPKYSITEDTVTDSQGTTTTTTEKTWSGEDHEPGSDSTVKGSETTVETSKTEGSSKLVHTEADGQEETTHTETSTETRTETLPEVIEKETGETVTETEPEEPVYDEENPLYVDEPWSREDLELEYGKDYGDISVDLKPGEEKKEFQELDREKLLEDNHEIPQAENDNTVISQIKDANGNVVGYETRITEVTEESSSELTEETETEVTHPEVPDTEEVQEVISLPEKPKASEPVNDEEGNTVTEEVLNIYDDEENIIGYTTVRRTISRDGKLLNSESNSVWGVKTTITTKTHTELTETVKKTTSTTVTSKVYTKGRYFNSFEIGADPRELSASMDQVLRGENHDHTDFETVQIDGNIVQKGDNNSPKGIMHRLYNEDFWKFISQYPDKEALQQGISCDYSLDWAVDCYGSLYNANTIGGVGPNHMVVQYALKDKDGNVHIVHCADLGINALYGAKYNMVNVEDAGYYDEATAKKIKQIVTQGFWATKNGVGSAQYVKDLLHSAKNQNDNALSISHQEIEKLTEGELMTAMQTAIWTYANRSDKVRINSDEVSKWFRHYRGDEATPWTYEYVGRTDIPMRIQAVYDYYIGLNGEEGPETDFINEDCVKGASISVGNKDQSGKYNAAVSFRLDLPGVGSNDKLWIEILDAAGNVIDREALSGDERIVPDANGNFKISGLKLSNNQDISLRLSGKQDLRRGAYLYSAPSSDGKTAISQTFIGLGSGSRDVDLSVGLRFQVKEPEAVLYDHSYSYDVQAEQRITEKRTDTEKILSGVKETKTEKLSESRTLRVWHNTGDGIIPIESETSPTPVTGDSSMIWYVTTLCSLAGFMLLRLLLKKNGSKT